MYWTLELASKLEDAPWPATREELLDYANRSGAPLEVIENLMEMEDEGEIYDISEQHVEMEQFEQEYLAQQQEEIDQHDTFAYEASDDQDYNNDVDYATV